LSQPPDLPPLPRPWATSVLLAANLAMFGVELVAGAGIHPDPRSMIALGGNYGPLTTGGEAWRLLSCMFLHYGALHLGMNMACLWQIRVVERMLGHAEFLALYLAAGLVGGLVSVASHPEAVSVGASGAVFGMFGAFTAGMLVRRRQIDPVAWRGTMRSLATFFALNLVLGLSERAVDLGAHAGGLAAGFAGAFVLEKTVRPGSSHLLRALAVAAIGAAATFEGVHLLSR
jgi:rhomboid protease GluP